MRVDDASLMDPEIQQSPYDYYRALREQAPVYRMPDTGAYIVSRYRDVQYVLKHPDIWANDLLGKAGVSMFQHEEAQAVLEAKGWARDTKLQADPPEHQYYRDLVSSSFTANRVKALEPFVRNAVEELADAMAEDEECDFIERFAAWLPIRVVTQLLGLPPSDAPQIRFWSDAWVEPLTSGISKEREIEVAELGVELQQYLAGWLAKKTAEPGKDVLSDLATAHFPDGTPVPMGEKIGIAEHLIVGGHETAGSGIALGLMLMIQHPEVEAELRNHPELLRNFVEETLRLESPSQGFFRFAVEDAEVGGVLIPQGSMVQVRFAAANRDPEQFPEPDKLDLHRPNAGSHLAFSRGEHHCIGAPLARLELHTSFRTLLDRFEDFSFDPGESLEMVPGLALRRLDTLRIRYRLRARSRGMDEM